MYTLNTYIHVALKIGIIYILGALRSTAWCQDDEWIVAGTGGLTLPGFKTSRQAPVLECDSGITWTSNGPILPVLPILAYWAIILGIFGGPGSSQKPYEPWSKLLLSGLYRGYMGSLLQATWLFIWSFDQGSIIYGF